MIVYRITGNAIAPEAVEITTADPEHDTDGVVVYENTHFADEAEAWKKLEAKRNAQLCNSVFAYEHAKAEADRMADRVVEAGTLLAKFQESKERKHHGE